MGGSSSGGGGGARFREMSGLTRTEMISHQTTKTTQGSFLDVKSNQQTRAAKNKENTRSNTKHVVEIDGEEAGYAS